VTALKTSYSKAEIDDIRRDGEQRAYFSRVPTPWQAITKMLRHSAEDLNNKKMWEMTSKDSFYANPYKVTYLKDSYPYLDKMPPIKFHYSGALLNDYCQMLHPSINNRDVIGFAIHNLDWMRPNCIKDIMDDETWFLAVFRLFEYYNFPHDVRDS